MVPEILMDIIERHSILLHSLEVDFDAGLVFLGDVA
jgi:hypothetical protein